MAGAAVLRGLIDLELRAWTRLGRLPQLWWRDDDARGPSPALARLLALSARHHAPLALAIIPDRDLDALAEALAPWPLVSPIQHGCDHVDRGDGGSAEFGPAAPVVEIAAAINAGWARLASLPRVAPVYAPPWNAISANVLAALDQTPIRALSLYGARPPLPITLPLINSHIDIMRWRPARFRGEAALLGRLWRLLRARRRAGRWDEPIGLLTHHRNLDPAAWTFLEVFLGRWAADGSPIAWRSVQNILSATGHEPEIIP